MMVLEKDGFRSALVVLLDNENGYVNEALQVGDQGGKQVRVKVTAANDI